MLFPIILTSITLNKSFFFFFFFFLIPSEDQNLKPFKGRSRKKSCQAGGMLQYGSDFSGFVKKGLTKNTDGKIKSLVFPGRTSSAASACRELTGLLGTVGGASKERVGVRGRGQGKLAGG